MKIAVVGGGFAGLVAARALRRAGHGVTIYEASARAGGVVQSSRDEGYLREHAASSFLATPDGALPLCRELGVAVATSAPAARRRWIYVDGERQALPGSPVALVKTGLLSWRGKLGLLGEPLRAARDATVSGDESVHDFAVRRFGPEVARTIVGPFVTGVFAADAREVGVAAGFPRLAELDANGGMVRGSVKRMIAAHRGAKGKPRPERGLWAPVGGMQAIVDALVAEAEGRTQRRRGTEGTAEMGGLRLGAAVETIARDGAGVILRGGFGEARADVCVLAVPAAKARGIVMGAAPELGAALAPLRRAGGASVFVGWPSAVMTGLDGFGCLIAAGEAPRVLGIVFESVIWPERAPAGQVLVRCIYGGSRDPAATQLDDAALIAQARADLAQVIGVDAAPSYTSVVRWPQGIAGYPVGHRERVAALGALARPHRIVLAGADYRGIALNDLVRDAETVCAEVAACG